MCVGGSFFVCYWDSRLYKCDIMWQSALLCVNQLHLSTGHLFRGHIFWCIPLWIFDLPMSDQWPKKKNFRNFDSLSFSASWTKFAFLGWENQGHDHLLGALNPTPGHLPQWLKTKSKTSFRPQSSRWSPSLFGRKWGFRPCDLDLWGPQ